ncbi:hypothetical protein F7230_06190 [Corynebacterium sp. 320]|uniref:hypothetical protein n=1 Tax=Corynebacterium TaxID=1716 RepID=UPI00125CD0EB|nr:MULTISPECIES: hypothetical protein [Corynebacterium]KAB1503120.1 hypothetical protein F7230_06190 [Corynebacterium sp. 320]KAB1550666.1 hypothetical protein F7233_08995 [Corynebacterium sp. 321]KAB1551028.1 hypothetical protein F7232_08175 [Corynebacterium sp. 319]KAB3526917.1 hypothetical protein F8354_06190 [Corynebacterium sp. 250]KAB3538410.1 hypothetical protein F8390_09090 [Corynebacterium sp. 366]
MSSTLIRQVQLADAVIHLAQHTLLPPGEGTNAPIHGHCNQNLFRKVMDVSCSGAESPPETILRLMVAHAVRDKGLLCLTQVPVFSGGMLVTTVDVLVVDERWAQTVRAEGIELTSFAWESMAAHVLAFQYDGSHHLTREQRDKDHYISSVLRSFGMREYRVTAPALRSFGEFMQAFPLFTPHHKLFD